MADHDLPKDWLEYWDQHSSRSYYFNTLTKQTIWERPAEVECVSAPVLSRTLPKEWQAHRDRKTGRLYYHNKRSSETVWQLPGTYTYVMLTGKVAPPPPPPPKSARQLSGNSMHPLRGSGSSQLNKVGQPQPQQQDAKGGRQGQFYACIEGANSQFYDHAKQEVVSTLLHGTKYKIRSACCLYSFVPSSLFSFLHVFCSFLVAVIVVLLNIFVGFSRLLFFFYISVLLFLNGVLCWYYICVIFV
jgi:hypothetical protein